MQIDDIDSQPEIYTVSRLNSEVRFILEDCFASIWVEGEISNFAAPNSGHWYFSLKDAGAQVKCAMFKSNQRGLKFIPKDGMHVLIRARASLYENRGDYQLIANAMEERGEGKLQRAFAALKQKLEAAGLFDSAHKKPLPAFPSQIGVITSATGAAIRDILTVLKRRASCLPIVIYPTLVQGDAAAKTIVKAIEMANQRQECDVLILARGGGSLEDLWPFNEEIVAHAIFASKIPIISGIGHEVDFTIADFVADKRAPTPSAAAEIVSPDCNEMMQSLQQLRRLLWRRMQEKITQKTQQLHWLEKHLRQLHPKKRLLEKIQQLDFYELSFVQIINRRINKLQNQLLNYQHHLQKASPLQKIQTRQKQLALLEQTFMQQMLTKQQHYKSLLENAAAKLNALSPLATLSRGFAIVTNDQGKVIQNSQAVNLHEALNIRLAKGSLKCKVVEKI